MEAMLLAVTAEIIVCLWGVVETEERRERKGGMRNGSGEGKR